MYGYDQYASYGAQATQAMANAAYNAAAASQQMQQAAQFQAPNFVSVLGDYSGAAHYNYAPPAATLQYQGYQTYQPQPFQNPLAQAQGFAQATGPPALAAYANAQAVAKFGATTAHKPPPQLGQPNFFESTVNTAVTSYLQSKATGQTNQWMNKKNPPGMKPMPPKSRFNGTSGNTGPPAQQFYCETCKISCAGPQTFKEHNDGQKHKKKLALASGEDKVTLPRNKVSFRCDLCNVTCTGQDSYNSHIKGSKHQKAVQTCKKMGKVVPQDQPTIIPPSQMGGAKAVPAPEQATAKKAVAASAISFVQSGALSTTGAAEDKKKACEEAVSSAGPPALDREVQALLDAEQSLKPIGEEFVEDQRDHTGKVIQFLCKLCDCKFSDPNAKDIHLKGRRHRLQYKVKVNPSIEVDIKMNPKSKNKSVNVLPRAVHMPYTNYTFQPYGDKTECTDDSLVMTKHNLIYPDEEMLRFIEHIVVNIEKALKNVSDELLERLATKNKVELKDANDMRTLKGVTRVTALAKQLVLKEDREVEVVLLMSTYPTEVMLREVSELIQKHCQPVPFGGQPVPVKTENQISQASILVSAGTAPLKCRISMTSPVARENDPANFAQWKPGGGLPLEKCLKSLAKIRHTKWFQARCPNLQSCQIVQRLLRDLRIRLPAWAILDEWSTELLVERVLASSEARLSPGNALRRVFEAISCGLLLKNGPGLEDPCEKEKTCALAYLTSQQREDITCSAQHALRLIVFKRMTTVLGIEDVVVAAGADRKRHLEEDQDGAVKRERKD
ncbi:unnamed protein product, partial [Mesorhabditis spiculigera]